MKIDKSIDKYGIKLPIIDLEKNTRAEIRTKRIIKPSPTDKITFNELLTFLLNLFFPSSPFTYNAKYTGSITIPHGFIAAKDPATKEYPRSK